MKKILLLLGLVLGFVSCSQEENIEQVSIATRAGVEAGFTNIQWHSDYVSEEISGDITCSAICDVSFKVGFNCYTSNDMTCTIDAGNRHYIMNYAGMDEFTAKLPEGTSKVVLRISRKYNEPSRAYAKLIITNVKGGSILGPDNAYGDLVVNMDKI